MDSSWCFRRSGHQRLSNDSNNKNKSSRGFSRLLLLFWKRAASRYAFTVAGAVNVSTMLPPASMQP